MVHKLKNIKESLSSILDEQTHKQLLSEAKAIYRHNSTEGARKALGEFGDKCGEREGRAVATLRRDFELTIAFYQLEGVALELARSTSLLERTNRELRRKLRQASLFGSETGAKVGLYLQVARLNGYWKGQSWWVVSQTIFFEHLNSHPWSSIRYLILSG